MTLKDLLARYATRHALKPRTVGLFRNSIDRFEAFLGRPATLDDFDDLRLAEFAEWRKADRHWLGRLPRPATVKKDLAQLSALWQHAAKKRLLKSDGTLIEHPDLPRGLVKVSLRPPRGYRLEELDAMLKAARGRKGTVGPVPAWWLWETLLTCAWQTGERIGGLLGLRWRDVDLDAHRVTFDGATRKGGVKTITRSITPELCSMLSKYRRAGEELVWPWAEHRRPGSLWSSLDCLCKAAGIESRGFHAIRKTSGSYVAAGGGDATEYLSHSDTKTTRDHYLIADIVHRGDDPLDLLPKLPSERRKAAPLWQPEAPAATSPSDAAAAGRKAGASLAARGLGCPPRAQHEALAAAAGIDAEAVSQFSAGLIGGWMESQG